MRPLRVSFVADTESWGGAEVWLAHHLRGAPDHDVEASVVCAEQVADRFRPLVPVGRLAVVPLARHAASAPATEAALLGQSPDVVHVNLVDPATVVLGGLYASLEPWLREPLPRRTRSAAG